MLLRFGFFAFVNFHVFYGEIELEEVVKKIVWEKKFIEYSKFPSSHRDLSIVVSESVKVDDIVTIIKSHSGHIIKNLFLFDQYKGKQIQEGTKSLSFSIEYQADDRTLSSEEVESLHSGIVNVLAEKYKAQLRS